MARIGGAVLFFSQLRTVKGLTPRSFAACFWVSCRIRRQRLMCSPKVWGISGKGLGLKAFSRMGTYGKKATRPCPCGYYGDPSGRCRCTPDKVNNYRARISGPLLDRIDMHIEVPPVPRELLLDQTARAGESSAQVQERVETARARQITRSGCANASLNNKQIEESCRLDEAGRRLLEQAIDRLGFSARAYHRVLKVARTIADLAAEEMIRSAHVAEAVQYRCLDRGGALS